MTHRPINPFCSSNCSSNRIRNFMKNRCLWLFFNNFKPKPVFFKLKIYFFAGQLCSRPVTYHQQQRSFADCSSGGILIAACLSHLVLMRWSLGSVEEGSAANSTTQYGSLRRAVSFDNFMFGTVFAPGWPPSSALRRSRPRPAPSPPPRDEHRVLPGARHRRPHTSPRFAYHAHCLLRLSGTYRGRFS